MYAPQETARTMTLHRVMISSTGCVVVVEFCCHFTRDHYWLKLTWENMKAIDRFLIQQNSEGSYKRAKYKVHKSPSNGK